MVERVADSCPQGFAWIEELEDCTSLDEIKRKPVTYPALEAKLATAVKKCIQKNYRRKIHCARCFTNKLRTLRSLIMI